MIALSTISYLCQENIGNGYYIRIPFDYTNYNEDFPDPKVWHHQKTAWLLFEITNKCKYESKL